jgi:hypothetical protein
VAASGDRELAGNRGEDGLHLIAQRDQDRDGDNGNESENQGVLNESLAFLALHPAQGGFGASYNFIDHYLFTSSLSEKESWALPIIMGKCDQSFDGKIDGQKRQVLWMSKITRRTRIRVT